MNGVKQGDHVLGWNFRKNVVDLLKDKPTTRPQALNLLSNMLPDLLWRTGRKNLVRITTSAPKGQPIAKILFEQFGFHSPAGNLDRIDRIQTGINQIGQERTNTPATVEHDLYVCQLPGPFPENTMTGLEELTIHLRRNLGPGLHTQVVTKDDNVDKGADQPQISLQLAEMSFH